MRSSPQNAAPADAAKRRKAPAIVCYSVDRVPPYDRQFYESARQGLTRIAEVIVPPREARTFEALAGHFFRIVSIDGPLGLVAADFDDDDGIDLAVANNAGDTLTVLRRTAGGFDRVHDVLEASPVLGQAGHRKRPRHRAEGDDEPLVPDRERAAEGLGAGDDDAV